MPHREDCCRDAINLLDALTGEIREAKRQVDSGTAMDLIEIRRLLGRVKDEIKLLKKGKRR